MSFQIRIIDQHHILVAYRVREDSDYIGHVVRISKNENGGGIRLFDVEPCNNLDKMKSDARDILKRYKQKTTL